MVKDRTEAVRYLLTLKRPAFSGVMSTDGRKALTAMVSKMPEVVRDSNSDDLRSLVLLWIKQSDLC